jgi:hypothetical protein
LPQFQASLPERTFWKWARPGGLTRALLRAGARVTAIEMDRRCLPALAELGEAFPGQLRVIEGDAMKIAPETCSKANGTCRQPAYNVGTGSSPAGCQDRRGRRAGAL